MSTGGSVKSLLKAVDSYLKRLDTITDEEFVETPAEGVWCYAEVYSHIMQANLYSLAAIEKCVAGSGNYSSKRIHWLAWLVLFTGRFPPGKFKVPKRMEGLVAKMGREDARNLTIKFRQRLLGIQPVLKHASAYQKIKHPRLGMLNARQWLRFIEIHTYHHIRQLYRIAAMHARVNSLKT